MPERRWPWKGTPANAAVTTPGQPFEPAGEQEARDEIKLSETTKQSLSLAESVVSCPSNSSSGTGTASTTPPTSVTSEGDSSGEKQTENCANRKRRAWWSTGNTTVVRINLGKVKVGATCWGGSRGRGGSSGLPSTKVAIRRFRYGSSAYNNHTLLDLSVDGGDTVLGGGGGGGRPRLVIRYIGKHELYVFIKAC